MCSLIIPLKDGRRSPTRVLLHQSVISGNQLVSFTPNNRGKDESKRKKISLLLKKLFRLIQKWLFHHNGRKRSDEGWHLCTSLPHLLYDTFGKLNRKGQLSQLHEMKNCLFSPPKSARKTNNYILDCPYLLHDWAVHADRSPRLIKSGLKTLLLRALSHWWMAD